MTAIQELTELCNNIEETYLRACRILWYIINCYIVHVYYKCT